MNQYKREMRDVIKERILVDNYAHATVNMIKNKWAEESVSLGVTPLQNVFNKHFEELVLNLLKIQYKAFDEISEMLRKTVANEKPKMIITTQERYDQLKEENGW